MAGRFLLAAQTVQAVAKHVKKVPANNAISVVDPPKSVSAGYPICTFTWVIVPLKTDKAPSLKTFIDWAVTKGQSYGRPLLFIKLPAVVTKAARKTTAKLAPGAWQHATHVEPAAFRAAGFDVPTRGLDHMLDDREPEPAPASGPRPVGAEEALEEARRVLLGDAGPVVGDLEHDLPILGAERDDAGGALAGVPDGVLEEVLGDGAQHPPAQRDADRLVREPELEPDAGCLGPLAALGDDVAENGRGLGLSQRDDLTPLLELAQEEDVVDQLRHLIDLLARLPEQLRQVRAGELGSVEQREEPGERRA